MTLIYSHPDSRLLSIEVEAAEVWGRQQRFTPQQTIDAYWDDVVAGRRFTRRCVDKVAIVAELKRRAIRRDNARAFVLASAGGALTVAIACLAQYVFHHLSG